METLVRGEELYFSKTITLKRETREGRTWRGVEEAPTKGSREVGPGQADFAKALGKFLPLKSIGSFGGGSSVVSVREGLTLVVEKDFGGPLPDDAGGSRMKKLSRSNAAEGRVKTSGDST